MTTNTPQQVLAQHCMRLRNADPRAWDEFVTCFDAYATEVTVAVTRADQNMILNWQGKAQAYLHLLDTFRNCASHSQPPKKQPPSAPMP